MIDQVERGRKHGREIACAILVDTCGRFLFQQRDNVPHIVAPGQVALFGGHREGGETFLECLVREIHEELSYFVSPDRFACLGRYAGPDLDRPEGSLVAEYYFARDLSVASLDVTEGSLLVVEPSVLPILIDRFAPSSRFAVDMFSSDERCHLLHGRPNQSSGANR